MNLTLDRTGMNQRNKAAEQKKWKGKNEYKNRQNGIGISLNMVF